MSLAESIEAYRMGTGNNRGSSIIEYNLFILKEKKKYEYIYNVHEISVLK